jgi:hypothetical protein
MSLGFRCLSRSRSLSACTIVTGVIEIDFKKGSDNINETPWLAVPLLTVVENRGCDQ